MRRALALTLALSLALAAGPAAATTYWISPSGSSGATGTSSGAPWSLAKANATLQPGDVCMVLPGTYASMIAPANTSTSGPRITYVGNLASPAAAVFPGNFETAVSYLTVKGMTFTGGISLDGTASAQAVHDSVAWCAGKTAMFAGAQHCVITRCTIANSPRAGATVAFVYGNWLDYPGDGRGLFSQYDTLSYNNIDLSVITWKAFLMRVWADHNLIKGNQITGTFGGPTGDIQGRYLYNSSENRFEDNRWTFEALSDSGGDWVCFALRDSSCNNEFIRDTILAGFSSGHSYSGRLVNAGVDHWNGTAVGNHWHQCLYYMRGYTLYQIPSDGTFLDHSVFATVAGPALYITTQLSNFNLDHCTLYSGNGRAMECTTGILAGTPTDSVRLRSNVFYSATTVASEGIAKMPGKVGYRSNNNVFYTPSYTTTPGDRAINESGVTMRLPSWCAASDQDCASTYGDPRFTSSLPTTFDPHLTAFSSAIGAGGAGSDAGALPFTIVTDRSAPSAISSLAVVATGQTTATLRWTATGNDSTSGTARTYDLRFSLAPITTLNFSECAHPASDLLSPRAAGTADSTHVSALTSGATYYFALKAGDAAGNWSGLSNVVSVTLPTPDVTPPAAVSDLVATVSSRTTLQLSWTATGDNGTSGAPAAAYDLRFDTSPISSYTWGFCTHPTSDILTPSIPPNMDVANVTGLRAGAAYYFALKVGDAAGNWSGLSNTVAVTMPAGDTTPPAAIADLAAVGSGTTTISLGWTATGNDGTTGTASSYDLRYSTAPLNAGNFAAASVPASDILAPSPPPNLEQAHITGLSPATTYYFALKASDDAGNWSAISNLPSATTWAAPGTAPVLTTVTPNWGHAAIGIAVTIVGANLAATTAVKLNGTTQDFDIVSGSQLTVYLNGDDMVDPGSYSIVVTGAAGQSSNALTFTATPDPAPAAPVIAVCPGALGTAVVTFTAVGEDSLLGTATSYDLTYRNVGDLLPDNLSYFTTGNITYHYDLARAPKASGLADTIIVYGLTPGLTYQFGLSVLDATSQPSDLSNVVSVTLPAAPHDERFPLVALIGGAGQGTVPVWWPLLNIAGNAINYGACDSLARYPVIDLPPNFADSAGTYGRRLAIAALQYLRQRNPAIRILPRAAGAQVAVSWLGGAGGWTTSADSSNRYNYYYQTARAVRVAAGWPANDNGDVKPTGAYGYTMDTTSVSGFLWKRSRGAGYKNYFWDVARSTSTAGGLAGSSSLTNVNLAFKSSGRFRIVDSLVAVMTRQFVTRRDWTGAFVWDGINVDNWAPTMVGTLSADGDSADWTRAGYTTLPPFNYGWLQAHNLFARGLRIAAVQAGRSEGFAINGNSGAGVAVSSLNGWTREGWPAQAGGTWASNFYHYPGGQLADQAFAIGPYLNYLFTWPVVGDSVTASPYTTQDMRLVRYGLGSACLTGHTFMYSPSYGSLALGGTPGGPYGNYSAWWYDEYGATPYGRSSAAGRTGWLGRAISGYLQTDVLHGSGHANAPLSNWVAKASAANSDTTWVGDFDQASDLSSWSLVAMAGQSTVGRVTDTTYSAGGALRINVGTRGTLDYQVGAQGPYGNVTLSDTISIEFWARSSARLPLTVSLRDSANGQTVFNPTAGGKVWIEPTWKKYVLIGACSGLTNDGGTGTARVQPVFWAGDTTGTWWIDDVRCVRGRPRGGLYYRIFERGVVVVNPYASVDTFVTPRPLAQLYGLPARATSVNSGARYPAGAGVPVPTADALFLIRPRTPEDK